MAKLSQIKLGNTTYDIGAAWDNISGKPSSFSPSSHTHNYAGSSSAGGSASTVAVTETTPTSATSYYLHYSTGVSGSQTTRANADLYYYDTGTSSYFNVGSSSNIGGLTLHYNNGKYVNLITDAVTANRDIKLPDASGTIALTGHTHNYAGSSSAGGAANSVKTNLVIKLNSGSTEGTNLFTFNGSTAKTINITPSAIGAATSGHNHDSTYVTLSTAQTISGTKTMTGSLKVSGRYAGGGDDEGIIVGFANNGYAGLCLGGPSEARSVFYFKNDGTSPFWRYNNGTSGYDIVHPAKSGTIALTSDIPTSMAWGSITGKPSTFTPSSHTHDDRYFTESEINTKLGSYLPLSGGNMTGHIYLTGAQANSSTGNTSQIIFGTSSNNHIALSSNNNAFIINPAYNSTTNQIVLYLDQASVFPSGISANLYGNADTATRATYADSAGTCTSLSTNAGSTTKAIYFSGGKPAQCNDTINHNISGNAATASRVNNLRTIGSSSQSHAEALASEFSSNKGNVPRNSLSTYYSSSYGNGSFYQGYFLSGYDANPYGGFYVCHYNTPYYVGIQNGSFTQFQLWKSGDAVTGAVWNDYAECRESDCEEFGYVLMETGDDSLTKTVERLSHFAGISSDTWGFSQGETEKAKTPIAVAGRALAHPYQDRNNYKPGDCVCAAPGGTVDIMTREEVINWPDRIVGTVSSVPDYEEWGGGNDREPIKVNGRIWIKVR